MPAIQVETLYVLDAHSLIFQVFHAIPEMSSPTGLPTNALFGFTRDLLFIRTELKPTALVCVFDPPGPTFREKIYPEYKAQRGPMPEALQTQLPMIRQVLDAMRIPVLQQPGFEADDVLATIAVQAGQREFDVRLCTSDKDCRQLISDHVKMYNLRKHQIFDRQALLDDWGIKPEQVVDLQTLCGDSVDNVPGVPGIGVKTAAKLLQEYGTLENILANIDAIPGEKRRQNLREAAGTIERTRSLVQLVTTVPGTFDFDAWRLQPWDAPRLLALMQEWGFHRFADQVRGSDNRQEVNGTPAVQGELFPASTADELFPFGANRALASANGSWHADYRLVDTPAGFRDFLTQLKQQRRFAIDLETTSLEPLQAEIVGLAFSWQAGVAYYVPLRGPEGASVLDQKTTLDLLRPILQDPGIAKINQNIKYDWLVLRHHGVEMVGIAGDPMVADYLLHAGERSHSLKDLSNRYLDHQVIEITELIGPRGKNQLRMDQVSTVRVAVYSGEDADVAWRLCERLEPELAEQRLKELYDTLEIPLLGVLAEMEHSGIRLDIPLLQRLSVEMATQLADLERQIHELAGHPFNIASPAQLRTVLFDELKLPTQRKTGVTGAASTNQETLERLAALGHSLPVKILEHRHIAKLKGTYVDALPALLNPKTGRVHTAFNQTVAATGRLSSSDPNLQNVPIRTEQGRQIRQAFIPAEGWTLLTVDYSQIELRLLAHFCGDAALRQAFAEDRDIHASVAAQLFDAPEDNVTDGMRRVAKTVNFGVIYGMSAHGLGQRLGMTPEKAAKFIDAYFARYPPG